MQELTFVEKDFSATFGLQGTGYPQKIRKPTLCPHCGAYVDGIKQESKYFSMASPTHYGFVKYKCPHCSRPYMVAYEINGTDSPARFLAFFPSMSVEFENERLATLSPKFIRYYNQARRAELGGDIELAATGYRMALECLVKDYAISELGKDRAEVAAKTLYNAIGEYLDQQELIAAADVVRILGNDYVHYDRRYPDQDFPILKSYMELFIQLVTTKLMLAHPPLAR